MKTIWYHIIKAYVRLGLFFTLKKIKIVGKENIPKNGAVIFIANHQNALIDALLIPTTNNRTTFFLTRASAFKNNFITTLLSSVNMIPVYRIRDGFRSIEKNKEVFEKSSEILKSGQCLQIFAEGEHHLQRRVKPLKRGFARIILTTLQKYPNLSIQIIPVGINYDKSLKFPCKVSVYYGKPINANNFINNNQVDLKFSLLKNEVHASLKKLTTHIENLEEYEKIIKKLNKNEVDFLNPITTNSLVKNIDKLSINNNHKKKKLNWLTPIYFITKINSLIPLLIWKYLKSKIKDVIFLNTYRFALITTIFPLFYTIQTLVIYYFSNFKIAFSYLIISILLGIITTKTTKIT